MEFQTIQLNTELSNEVTQALEGELLGRRHYDLCVAEDAQVLKPNGQPLLKLVRNVLPAPHCKIAWQNYGHTATRPIIGGSRATAAGASLQPTCKRDGLPGRMLSVPDLPRLRKSYDAVAGFLDRSARYPYCRQTAFGPSHPLIEPTLPFIRAVGAVFREHMPNRYAAQMEYVARTAPEFVIRGTAFTTLTINKNWQTAAHTDQGDLPEGFGVLAGLHAGKFSGGELIFPKYRVAVKFGSQDVLLADVHELHGNAPIVGVPGKYERISCVFYYRKNMVHCGSMANEIAFAQNRRPGDPLYPESGSHAISALTTGPHDERGSEHSPTVLQPENSAAHAEEALTIVDKRCARTDAAW